MSTAKRRVVTVLFCDLVNFTGLAESMDAEDVAGIQEAYFARAAATVAEHEGDVEKFIGDAVVATFGALRTRDDDAVRAVRAALALIDVADRTGRSLGLPDGSLQVRVGVNTGEVVVTRGEGWRVTGDVVNTAARLQAAAEPGSVLLGPETAFGVAHAFDTEPLGELRLKGKGDPLPTWGVRGVRTSDVRGLDLHGLSAPLLGRTAELDAIASALDAPDGPGALLVVAPPGVGKTRLVLEAAVRARAGGHPVWQAHPGQVTEGGYDAVRDLLRPAVELLGDAGPGPGEPVERALRARGYSPAQAARHARHVDDLLAGRPLTAEPTDLFTAWTATLDAPTGAAPVWLVEDLHLAGPDLRAFLQHALRHRRPGGRLVLLTARPTGMTEADRGWVDAPVLHLEPLSRTDTHSLLRHLVGPDAVPDGLATGMVEASGGNPLFVEELLRSWIQSGVLERTDARWRVATPVRTQVPTTVHAIYQAQLDTLPAPSRAVVERGSVPGITFPLDALASLGVTETQPWLAELIRAGLLTGPHEDLVTRQAFTYRHALLRDTAYGSLARRGRAELHVRFARWLQSLDAGTPHGQAELVGTHLALAVESLPATSPALADGTPAASIAREAAGLLETAASSALVSSPQRAAMLVRRVLDLPGEVGGADRLRRFLLLAEAERRSGRLPEALVAFATAGEQAMAREDGAALLVAALGYESALLASRLPRQVHGARSVQLLRAAEATLDGAALADRARVLSALGQALRWSDDLTGGEQACSRAVALAEESGDQAALTESLLAHRAIRLGDPRALPERLAVGARARAAADRTDDLELRFEVCRLRLTDLLEAGDVAGADEAQGTATDLEARLGRPLHHWYPPMWRSMRCLLAGRYAEAPRLIDEFREHGRRAHYADTDLVHTIQRMRLLLDTTGAPEVLAEVGALAEQGPDRWTFAPALILARSGEVDAARDLLDRYVATGFTTVVRDLGWTSTMAHLAEAVQLTGDADAAQAIATLLRPWAEHVVVLGSGALCLGAASHHLGISLATAGDHAGAAAALTDAVARNDALGAPGLAAQSRADLAVVLARLGRPREAASLATAAASTAERLGMTDLVDRLASGPVQMRTQEAR